MTQGDFPIVYKSELTSGIYDIVVSCPPIAKEAHAGQFVHIECDGHSLRRPISICEIEKDNGEIRLVFGVKGSGTDWISKREVGDCINIIGPIGNGFDVDCAPKSAIVIGGGIGTPPMLGTAKDLGADVRAIIGFRNKSAVILEDDFNDTGCRTIVCTDDGSYGFNGFVTQALEKELQKSKADVIYACGPMPMLSAIAKVAENFGVRCQVSLEERMGCGVGACLVCACKIKTNGEEGYKRVCKDGPVFEAEEVVFGG